MTHLCNSSFLCSQKPSFRPMSPSMIFYDSMIYYLVSPIYLWCTRKLIMSQLETYQYSKHWGSNYFNLWLQEDITVMYEVSADSQLSQVNITITFWYFFLSPKQLCLITCTSWQKILSWHLILHLFWSLTGAMQREGDFGGWKGTQADKS